MRNVPDKSCKENKNMHVMFKGVVTFFVENEPSPPTSFVINVRKLLGHTCNTDEYNGLQVLSYCAVMLYGMCVIVIDNHVGLSVILRYNGSR